MLFKKYLLSSVAVFSPETEAGVKTDEEVKVDARKTAKEIRDAIKVDSVKPEEETKEETDEPETEVVEGTEVAAKEEEIEQTEEKIETQEEKEEELEEQVKNAETAKERDKFQKRLNREVAKRKALETELAEARAQLAAKPDANLTEEEVSKRAEQLATQKDVEREFIKTSNRLYEGAEKVDKDVEKKVKDLVDDLGAIPSMLIAIMGDMKNGPLILKHFLDNHDDAEKYYDMAIRTPIKAAAEIKELDLRLTPKPKAISKVPPPNKPIGGGANGTVARENMNQSTDDWIKTRNARLRAEGKM